MAKRQGFVVGSTNPVTATKTTAQLNTAWNKLEILKAGDLDGVMKSTSYYGNDSSNEIANAILYMTGTEPAGATEHELADALQYFREQIESKGLSFKGFISTTEPSSSEYTFEAKNLWIKSAVLPTVFPIQPVNTTSITLSDENTYTRDGTKDTSTLFGWTYNTATVWTDTINPTTESTVYELGMEEQTTATVSAITYYTITDSAEITYTRYAEGDTEHETVQYYAWKDGSDVVFYTLSATPAAGDAIYDNAFAAIAATVASFVYDGVIVNSVEYYRYATGDKTSYYAWKSEADAIIYTTSITPALSSTTYLYKHIVSSKTIESVTTEQILKTWSGTAWVNATEAFQITDFDFFRNVNDHEGYYWFGGQWMVMSTDMSTEFFVLNQTTGKWEIKENVELVGTPSTTATPAVSDTSKKLVNCEYIGNKFLVVNALPATPDPNVFYFVIGE